MAENLTFNLDVDSSKAVASINTFFAAFDKGASQAKSKLNTAFGQTIQTDIKVEFKNGELVAKKVQSLKQESNRLAQAYKAVNGELGKTPNQLKRQKSILIALLGDTQKFEAGTRKVTAEWGTLTEKIRRVDAELKQMEGTMGRVASRASGGGFGSLAAKFVSIQTAANLATAGIMKLVRDMGELINTGFRMETLNLQMEAFAGGSAEAEAAMTQFLAIAANSPLNLEQVASAGKIMMAFGISTEDAVEATEQLAIVSAATGGDINLLARNLGQVSAQGRAYTRDLTQFAIQGIPIWEELSVVTGHSVTSLKEMATQGQIGFKEVQAAMANMTAEGTAFAQVADRMQETFAGRLAKIEAAFQNLAGEAVEAFNLVDEAMGGIVSGSMTAFANSLNGLAENMNTIALILGTLTTAVATFFAVFGVGKIIAIVTSLGGVISTLGLMKGTIIAALGAQLSLMGAMGPIAWASAAAGIAAAAGAFVVIKGNIDASTESVEELTAEVGVLNEEELKAAKFDHRRKAYKDARKEADEYRNELDLEVEKLNTIKKAMKAKYDDEKARIKGIIEQKREAIQEEKAGLKEAKQEIDEKYKREKTHLDEVLAKVREKYSEEISALQELGPAQEALYEFEKKKLQEEIASGKLDSEALLRARARLERMQQQEQVAALRKKQAEEEETILGNINKLEANREKAIESVEKKSGERIKALEEEKRKEEESLKRITEAYEDNVREIDKAVNASKRLGTEVEVGTRAVGEQIRAVEGLTEQWRLAETAARNAAAAIREANQAASNAANSGGGANRASGGPVSGGSVYTVNELGKEAFLSASGKLSMINAPSYGQWRAPGAGTVIPAHLTRKLDVPSGGVNLNKSANASASRAGKGGSESSRLVNAIRGLGSGTVNNNNVSIQAANPTKAASDMLVQLTRIKQRRYS